MKSKKIRFLCYLLLISTFLSNGQNDYSGVDILELINNKKWFDVKELYEKEKSSFNDFFQLRTESYLYTHFNKPQQAIDRLEIIANEHAESLKLDIIPYLDLLAKNYASVQQYDKSHEIYSYMLKTLSNILPPDNINQLKEATLKFDALKKLPKHKVTFDASKAPIPVDTINGLIYLTIHKNNFSDLAIFDTGANMNYATEEIAKKLGITTILDSYQGNEGKITGKIGILDTFEIGNNTVRNALFYIVPSDLNITQRKADLIIGSETLRLLKGIRFNFNKMELTFYQPEHKDILSNMVLDNGLLFFNLSVNDIDGIFQYDSGNTGDIIIDEKNIEFKPLFQDSHSEEQRFITVSDTVINNYLWKENLSLKINEKPITAQKVYYGNTAFVAGQKYDGVIGKAVIDNYSILDIDFVNMLVKVNN
nr:retropepsin-like aspartic protease [uncultured Carboxylicivirga sp.]